LFSFIAGSRSRGSCGPLYQSNKYFCAGIHAGPFDPWTLTFCTCGYRSHIRDRVQLAGVLCREIWEAGRRRRPEPPQVYGSTQVELAWTVIPILIVVVLFMATARVIASIQKGARPANAIQVIAIGHQFWWEYRYPGLKVVTANELHVPVSDPAHPTPTFITLLSGDTDHSFWVPGWPVRPT